MYERCHLLLQRITPGLPAEMWGMLLLDSESARHIRLQIYLLYPPLGQNRASNRPVLVRAGSGGDRMEHISIGILHSYESFAPSRARRVAISRTQFRMYLGALRHRT